MAILLPPEITFGYVVGRWILAVGDTEADPDEYPDAAVPTGTVTFTRIDENVSLVDTTQNDGTWVAIARKSVMTTLNDQGELALPHAASPGIWLVTGAYTVAASVAGVTWPSYTIIVTEDHTPQNPLDLLTWAPITPSPVVQLVTSYETALRAEAAAVRAETAAANLELKEGNYAPDLSGLVPIAQPRNTQTGTEYTLVASDAGKLVTLDNNAAITVTVPASTITVPEDTVVRVDFLVLGAGVPTFVGSGGMTINADPSLVADAQYAGLSLLLLSATSGVLVGRLATP